MQNLPPMMPPRYESLPWDSAHYRLKIGRVAGDVSSEKALNEALGQAQAAGAQLVYFLKLRPFTIGAQLLERHGGLRVGGHVRLACDLQAADPLAPQPVEGLSLGAFEGSAEDPSMLALGLAASSQSRFRTDPRLPPEKCDELYLIWTKRSILREIADEVLVARFAEGPVGMLTFSIKQDTSQIGLMSTAAHARGRGVGGALLAYAQQKMTFRGVQRCEVTTQTDNSRALRLYKRAGFLPIQQGEYYHFRLA